MSVFVITPSIGFKFASNFVSDITLHIILEPESNGFDLLCFKISKKMLTSMNVYYIICLASQENNKTQSNHGVWLSLARAPGLGPGGRRFESCHPDYMRV